MLLSSSEKIDFVKTTILLGETPVVFAEKPCSVESDTEGSFRIIIDRLSQNIVAAHYSGPRMDKPDKIVKGKTANAIYSEIAELGLAAEPNHLAYLGSELAKAEIALRTGKQYIQDTGMFAK